MPAMGDPPKVDKMQCEIINSSQIINLLTRTAALYFAKLKLVKHGKNDKKSLDANKIKKSVQHLSVWIIRNYGIKSNEKHIVSVKDDEGNIINGEFYHYDINITKQDFAKNIYLWLKSYADQEGNIQNI